VNARHRRPTPWRVIAAAITVLAAAAALSVALWQMPVDLLSGAAAGALAFALTVAAILLARTA